MRLFMTIFMGISLAGAAQAQLFTPESFNGAVLGGIIGGVVGHNNHGQTAEGIAIGAGAGYVLGELAHYRRQREAVAYNGAYYPYNNYPYYQATPAYGDGYAPAYSPQGYPYQPRYRPNYALTGAALGGISGAIIGNQFDGQSGEGAAIGAAAGLVLGGVAESRARQREWEQVQALYRPVASPGSSVTAPLPRDAQRAPSLIKRPGTPSPETPLRDANRLFGR